MIADEDRQSDAARGRVAAGRHHGWPPSFPGSPGGVWAGSGREPRSALCFAKTDSANARPGWAAMGEPSDDIPRLSVVPLRR